MSILIPDKVSDGPKPNKDNFILFDFELEYFVEINVVIKNEKHFNYWLGVLPFYDNVKQDGIELDG